MTKNETKEKWPDFDQNKKKLTSTPIMTDGHGQGVGLVQGLENVIVAETASEVGLLNHMEIENI